MKKIDLTIIGCRECPWLIEMYQAENACKLTEKPIKDRGCETIPDWCPLPDKEERG